MRRLAIVLVLTATSFGGLPAHAQLDLDMDRITCGDWLSYDYSQQQFIRYWMSGYYSASKNNDVLDFKRLQSNSAKVMAYCKKHKAEPLPKAINKNAS
jgi:hypothetical protein